MPKETNLIVDEELPVVAPEPETAPAEKLPYGQNPGDVVDASDARGGCYEAIGGGKLRRL